MGCRAGGLVGWWAVGLVGCWAGGLVGCWAVGLVGCWAGGLVSWWAWRDLPENNVGSDPSRFSACGGGVGVARCGYYNAFQLTVQYVATQRTYFALTTKFRAVAPIVCGSLVWSWHRVTLPVHTIVK